MVRARVRGIYATALTARLLDAGHEVVDASPPIRRRFDAAFGTDSPDVRVETSGDRQGIGAHGDPDALDAVRDLLVDAGRDALAWADPTPPGAVLDGEVTETLGGGAVVDLRVGGEGGESGKGEEAAGAPATAAEGYLPYGDVDARVETGDPVRVQVRESAAPWTDRRPELAGELRVGGDLVALEPGSGTRVDVRDDEAARELSGMLDLLDLDPPDGWRAVWRP
ncbi:RNA-binding protein, partial [Halorubrum sp. SS5]